MTRYKMLDSLSARLAWLSLLVAVGTGACGSEPSGDTGFGGGIFIDGEFVPNCTAPVPPEAEPELLAPPVFGAEELPPGSAIEADIEVDAETRTVRVELVDFWKLERPPLQDVTLATSGDETLLVSLSTDPSTRGRYFFRITLCGEDCEESRVLFTIIEDPDDPDARVDPYQRLVFEGDTEVRRTTTCYKPDSVAIQ